MDVLSKVLDSLHFNGSFYFATDFYSPWSVEVPKYKNVARFHYVARGLCWVRVGESAEPVRLSAGDIIIIPHGTRHILSDTEDRDPISLDEAFAKNNYEGHGLFTIGGGAVTHGTQLVCGHFEFSESFRHPFLSQLPSHIVKQHTGQGSETWIKDTLNFLSHTANANFGGSAAVIKRLSEVLFIQMVHYWNRTNELNKGFVAALNDQQISKGLLAFHNNFADDWTVEKLAFESNMSRSSFAERFKAYMGESPMQYVTTWRLENAKRLLHESQKSLERIANEIGYESAAAFSKAFKRAYDRNPGEFRKSIS